MSCTVLVSSVDLCATTPELANQMASQLTCELARVQGVSNFPAYGVMKVYYKCKELGFVLPSVYEGTAVLDVEPWDQPV